APDDRRYGALETFEATPNDEPAAVNEDARRSLRYRLVVRDARDAVVAEAALRSLRAHVEIRVEADVQVAQRVLAVVRDRELEPGDRGVAGIRPGVCLLVNGEAERPEGPVPVVV